MRFGAWLLCLWMPLAQAGGIGVIDIEAVLAAAKQTDDARQQWQLELAPLDNQIQALIERGQTLETEYQRTVSATKRADLEARMQPIRVELRDLQRRAQTRLAELENQYLQQQLPILESLVIELAEENNLDLVVRADAVVWGRAAVNLSDDLLQRYSE